MKTRARFPLMAQMLLWLLVHLGVVAAVFAGFVAWQLRLGLDSLLSGTAGERLKDTGEEIAAGLKDAPRDEWPDILKRHETALGLRLHLELAPGVWVGPRPEMLPENVARRIWEFRRLRARPPRGPGGPPAAPPDRRPPVAAVPPPAAPARPRVKPDFLMRGNGGSYWAGIELPLFEPSREMPRHGLLLLRSQDLSGGGLFFDLRPWWIGGAAVLGLSLLLWAPFFFGITRYVSRLSKTTEAIAEGKFDARVGAVRSDELGSLGTSIETMAARLDNLVRGQKRFLGDVAHELCSPLARIRTGLGVMEYGLSPEQQARLESIEEDVEELSGLVSELLAFTKASTAPGAVKCEPVELSSLLDIALSRECPGQAVEIRMPEGLAVSADRNLLARAIANVLRNARRHGGEDCSLEISATVEAGEVVLRIADDGPGVAPADLPRLFEPFYRPDAARTREAGGSGLGLAIVRAGIEACGGTVRAEAVVPRGLALVFRLRAA